jgi:hypothetical protein
MKLILSFLDLLLRVVAGVTVLAICVLAFFVGGMAGLLGLFAIVLPTIAVSIWIVLCAFNPGAISRMLPDSAAWRLVLMKLPVYAVACVGIYGGIFQWSSRYGTPSVMVGRGDRQFPVINPSPTRQLEISGTLPLTVPVKDLLAIYAVDSNSSQNSPEACTRRQDFMPKNDTSRYPLVHIEHIPMVRTGETYRSSVAIDRFNPGLCGWHLDAVTYLPDIKGYTEKDFAYYRISLPHVELLTQPQNREPANRSDARGARADVWCWKVTNHEYNPFLPVRCGNIKDALTWPGQHAGAAISVAERASTGIAFAGPDSSSVEFNFHDFDSSPSRRTDAPSQMQVDPAAGTSSLASPTPPPRQITQSLIQVRQSQPPATGNLPSPANVEVGRPVNIGIGDSLDAVQLALGIQARPEPTHSAVHANSQSLTLKDSGVRFFFDESKKVYTIRIDAPFVGKFGGRELYRTREELDRSPGPPAKRIEALSNRAGSSFISDIDASTSVRYDFDASGRLITAFLLSGTMQINLGATR